MKLKPSFLSLFVCFLCTALFTACKKEAVKQPQNNTSGVQQFFTYPFGIGREWRYETEIVIYDGTDTTFSYYIKTYRHISDTTIAGELCHKVFANNKSINDSIGSSGYTYYCNRSNGLFVIAGEGNAGGFTWFKLPQKYSQIQQVINGYDIFNTDSLFIPDSSLHLTLLPIIYGHEWRSFEYGAQANVKRKWINQEMISVPVGNFSCKKLEIILNDPHYQVFQYFSEKGLTKTTYYQDNILFSGGTVTGWMTTNSELSYVNF